MQRENYKRARDAAWRTLIEYHIAELPVRVSSLCEMKKIVLFPYSKNPNFISTVSPNNETDGFTIAGTRTIIFYNDQCTAQRCRFTIAHELGHIVLGHLKRGEITQMNREPDPKDNELEQESNIFASRLLAPACVLHALHINTPEEIAKLCDISIQSARFRAERMHVLNARNKFLLSPLEQKVIQQFQPFITSHLA